MEVNDLFDDIVQGDDTNVETGAQTENNNAEITTENNQTTVENTTQTNSEDIQQNNNDSQNNDAPTNNLGWIDQYLELNGVHNSEIVFEGDEKKSFHELTDVEKVDILNQLKEQDSGFGEEISKEDKELINILKEKKMSIDELVELEVNERLNSINTDEQILNADIKSLSDDEVNYAYYRKNNPDKTKEEIDELIQLAKEDIDYSSNTEKKRAVLETEMNVEKELILKKKQEENAQMIEDSIAAFVDHITPLTEIGNTIITEDIKEELLEDLVTVESNGQSKFLNEFLSDPEKMFKASFYLKYGDQIEKSYEEDLQTAYKRGYESSTNGGDVVQHTFVDNKNNKTTNNGENNEEKSTKVTDLYN